MFCVLENVPMLKQALLQENTLWCELMIQFQQMFKQWTCKQKVQVPFQFLADDPAECCTQFLNALIQQPYTSVVEVLMWCSFWIQAKQVPPNVMVKKNRVCMIMRIKWPEGEWSGIEFSHVWNNTLSMSNAQYSCEQFPMYFFVRVCNYCDVDDTLFSAGHRTLHAPPLYNRRDASYTIQAYCYKAKDTFCARFCASPNVWMNANGTQASSHNRLPGKLSLLLLKRNAIHTCHEHEKDDFMQFVDGALRAISTREYLDEL